MNSNLNFKFALVTAVSGPVLVGKFNPDCGCSIKPLTADEGVGGGTGLQPCVAAPPKLIRLKCANHLHKDNTG